MINSFSDKDFNILVLDVFRLSGYFLHAADHITAGSRLTAARWQVLGSVLHESLTVANIARNMGLTRQSVQRIADILVKEGLCEYQPNPAHRRSKLLLATTQGLQSIQQIRPKVLAWSKKVRRLVGEEMLYDAACSIKEIIAVLPEIKKTF